MTVIGIGTEIVECLRIAQMIERHGEQFLSRVFTPGEIEFCSSRNAATQQYAGRWAAKEAVAKAMGLEPSGGMQWTDIEIRPGPARLEVALAGRARDVCEQLGATRLLVSIAHCRTHATAFAIVEDEQ